MQTTWERQTNKKIQRNAVKRKMESIFQQQKYSLEERRDKYVVHICMNGTKGWSLSFLRCSFYFFSLFLLPFLSHINTHTHTFFPPLFLPLPLFFSLSPLFLPLSSFLPRLRDQLQHEEAQYMSELTSLQETPLERQAKMRERAKMLRDRREQERLVIVEDKLEQRWRYMLLKWNDKDGLRGHAQKCFKFCQLFQCLQ